MSKAPDDPAKPSRTDKNGKQIPPGPWTALVSAAFNAVSQARQQMYEEEAKLFHDGERGAPSVGNGKDPTEVDDARVRREYAS